MTPTALPDPATWQAAAARRPDLFGPLDAGAAIGLIARGAPTAMLVWQAGPAEIGARMAPFVGFTESGMDILLAADEAALAAIREALDGSLFDALRAAIRSGSIVCYVLKRRCDLEARGYEELLEALGYAFMGACR